jgi:hypothetical protein
MKEGTLASINSDDKAEAEEFIKYISEPIWENTHTRRMAYMF